MYCMPNLAEMEEVLGPYSNDLFARGYIISTRPPVCPESWNQEKFEEYYIATHPLLRVSSNHSTRANVLVIGILFDTRYPQKTEEECVPALRTALESSEKQFLEEIYNTGGRYIVIYKRRGEDTYLIQDATGMKTVLFHEGTQENISSHMKLLKLNDKSGKRYVSLRARFGFPGRQAPLENTFFLTPNTKLNMHTMCVERFWPTRPLSRLTIQESIEYVIEKMDNSAEWINNTQEYFSTLTAGLDSRVTLSVFQKKCRYLTYFGRNDENKVRNAALRRSLDRSFATSLAKRYSLSHAAKVLPVVDDKYKYMQGVNCIYSSQPAAPLVYLDFVGGNKFAVHVRSNVSEVGRMFYGKRNLPSIECVEDFAQLWSGNKQKITNEELAAFEDWLSVTDLREAPIEKSSLFYWEHRMGTWHTNIATESDPACDTLSLFNCRAVLEAMLSVPEEEQKKSTVVKEVIRQKWPELAGLPVNGEPF